MMQKKSKVLLTGATGFIGGYVAKHLLKKNVDLFCTVRSRYTESNFYKLGIDKKVTIIKCDLTNARLLKKVLHKYKFDYVVHLAGILRPKNLEEAFEGNVEPTINLIEALEGDKSLKGIIFASSSRSIVNKKGNLNFEDLFSKPYDFSKTVSDLFVSLYIKEKKLPIVLVKYPTAFGAGDTYVKPLRLTPQIMENVRNGKEFKVTNNSKVQLAYVEDIAEEFVKVFKNINKYKYKTVVVKPLVNTYIEDWAKRIEGITKSEVIKNKVDKLLYKTFYNLI